MSGVCPVVSRETSIFVRLYGRTDYTSRSELQSARSDATYATGFAI